MENDLRILNKYFDNIFVITVPRFTERQNYITQQLKGLEFKFYWGQDKLSLNIEKAKQDGTYDEEKTKLLQRQSKPLNEGELACALSHRNLYKDMIRSKWKRVLVLEDDILPLRKNLSVLAETLSQLPFNWELVYLGYLKNEKVTPKLKFKKFIYKIKSVFGLIKWKYKMVDNFLPKPHSKHLKKAGFHDCTHAYAITIGAAEKLLKAQTPVVYRADDLLSHTILKGELEAFITNPKFFDQESFHNTNIESTVR